MNCITTRVEDHSITNAALSWGYPSLTLSGDGIVVSSVPVNPLDITQGSFLWLHGTQTLALENSNGSGSATASWFSASHATDGGLFSINMGTSGLGCSDGIYATLNPMNGMPFSSQYFYCS